MGMDTESEGPELPALLLSRHPGEFFGSLAAGDLPSALPWCRGAGFLADAFRFPSGPVLGGPLQPPFGIAPAATGACSRQRLCSPSVGAS